jgi:acyl carrier protein
LNLEIQTNETDAVVENHLGYNMENLEEQIKDIMAKSFLIDRAKLEDHAELEKDLGVDSLSIFEMVINIEDTYKIDVKDRELLKFTKVGDAVSVLADLIRKETAQDLPS